MISQGRGTSTAHSRRARSVSSGEGVSGKDSKNASSSSPAHSGTLSQSLPRP